MRYDAISCPLPADKELVGPFGASSLIHADRNGLPRQIAHHLLTKFNRVKQEVASDVLNTMSPGQGE
jgi:hypothetical protein